MIPFPARLRPLVALFAGPLIALAACTSAQPTATPTPAATPTPVPATATSAPFASPTPRPPEPDGLERGGVLRIAFSERPPHNDPHLSSALSVVSWGPSLVYSRIFRLQTSPDSPNPSRLIECELCETWRFTNATTLEVKLRPEAAWQDAAPLDGRPVTADDVVFSLNRIATPGFANAALLANVDSVTASDEHTVVIALKTPDAEVLEKLAHAAARIVAPEAVEENGDLRDGPNVGSGPWIFEEINPTALTLEAVRDYWEEGLPYLDGLAIQYIADPDTRQSAVRTGFLDVDQSSPPVVRAAVERFPDFGSVLVPQPDQGVEVALNTEREPLDSLEVRAAIFSAWDPQAIIDEVWGGDAFVSLGLSPPVPSWLEMETNAFAGVFADRQRALDMLASTDLAGVTLTIRVGDFSDKYKAHAEALAASMTDIGISTGIEIVSTRIFGEDVWLGGDYDIMVGAAPPVSGLTARLFSVYHSGGPWNTTGYGADELDRLIEKQAAELDPAARRALYPQVVDAIVNGRHRFNSAAGVTAWMWRPNVHGLSPNTQLGDMSFLLHVWLDR